MSETQTKKREETRREAELRRALSNLVKHVRNEKRIHPFSLNVREGLERAESVLRK